MWLACEAVEGRLPAVPVTTLISFPTCESRALPGLMHTLQLSYNPARPMTATLLKLFLVFLLVLINGFFVAVEFALVSLRRARIETLASGGKMGAQSVLWALDHLDAMLSASQFGITLASL